jgi:hypothetical protein
MFMVVTHSHILGKLVLCLTCPTPLMILLPHCLLFWGSSVFSLGIIASAVLETDSRINNSYFAAGMSLLTHQKVKKFLRPR